MTLSVFDTDRDTMQDLIIIGGGPAGITAGIYAARKKLNTLLITKDFIGQVGWAFFIENYPGFDGILGQELMAKFKKHLEKFEIDINEGEEVMKIEKENDVFKILTSQKDRYLAKTVVIASGRDPRPLEVAGEKEFLGHGISYCTTCLPPGEEIVANNSLAKIEELGIAQKVLTVDGSFQNIKQIVGRDYNGEIIKIKTKFFTEPVKLTANHPVLTTRIERDYYRKILRINKPRWKRAGLLTEEDALLYPVISKTKDVKKIRFSEILGVEVQNGKAKNNQETHTSHRIPDEIPINEKFLRLAGYYLSEGCITRHGINIYFNKKENKFINDVKNLFEEVFSLKVYSKTVGGVTRVSIFSKLVKDLFLVLFGKYAPNKKIPHWMLFLPKEKQKEIIKGFYRGDGCLRAKDFCIVTTSRTLSYQLRDILLRFNIIPGIEKREKEKLNKTLGEIGRRKIRFNYDKYHIRIGGPSLEKMSEILGVHHPRIDTRKQICKHAWIKDSYLYLPIREIKRENYKGKVYNLLVDESNTYVAKNFIVHNCDAPLFRNKNVAVIGGGNSGFEAALELTKYCPKIYILERGSKPRADEINQERAKKTAKIEVLLNAELKEIRGKNFVNSITYKDLKSKKLKELKAEGVFVQIGLIPATGFVKGLVDFNKKDEIKIDPKTCATKTPGLFAAGDVTDVPIKQIIVAAAEGAKASLSAYEYLSKQK